MSKAGVHLVHLRIWEQFCHVQYSTINRDCDFLLGSLLVSTLFSSHDGIGMMVLVLVVNA